MKTSSAKNKGRMAQKLVIELIRKGLDSDKYQLNLSQSYIADAKNDLHSRSMGASGTDVIIGQQVADLGYDYAIEVKNQERVNVWASYDQCVANSAKGALPVLVIKKNRTKPLVVVDAEWFFSEGRYNHES